jgi:hypothetical protein
LIFERPAAENPNNTQQLLSEDQRVTCKIANSFALRPFRPSDPINLRREVLYQNRLPIGRDLPDLPDIQRVSGEVPM